MGKGSLIAGIAIAGGIALGAYLFLTGKLKLPKFTLPDFTLPDFTLPDFTQPFRALPVILPPEEVLPTVTLPRFPYRAQPTVVSPITDIFGVENGGAFGVGGTIVNLFGEALLAHRERARAIREAREFEVWKEKYPEALERTAFRVSPKPSFPTPMPEIQVYQEGVKIASLAERQRIEGRI